MTPVLIAPLFDPGVGRIDMEMPAGLTIAQMVARGLPDLPEADRLQARVILVTPAAAWAIDPLHWHVTRPKPGVQVVIRIVPGKSAMRSVLMIAVSVASVALGGPLGGMLASTFGGSGALWTAAATLGINVLGSLLVNALIPPPQPREERPSYAISGWRNRFEPDAAVPVVLGKMRYAPPFAASSWTEIVGDLQYVRALFTFGYGPLVLSDLRLGETPLSEYDEIDIEIFEGRPGDAPSLIFSRQVFEEMIGVDLTRPKPRDDMGEITSHDGVETPVVRTTGDDASAVSLILGFPAGLTKVNDEGELRSYSVRIRIEQRLAGQTAWSLVQDLDIRASQMEAFYRQHGWSLPVRGRWEIRLTRLSTDSTNSAVSDRASWVALQTIRPEYPIAWDVPQCLVALRIKATHQLNGSLDNLSAVAARPCLDYDHVSGAWVERMTSNPAALYRYALQSPANPRRVGDAGIDLDQLADWHDFCRIKGLTFADVLDEAGTTLRDVLTRIAAAGRATPRHDGLRWGVTVDRPQGLIVDHISPRNSWGFKTSRNYVRPPDAIRVKFQDATNDWAEAERLVEWLGHSGPVDLTELLELPGKTDPDEVWREATRRMLEAKYRPDTYEAMQDGAVRVATRGDLVSLSMDVLDDAQRAARVQAVHGDLIVLDEPLEIRPGEDYGIRFRVFAGPGDTVGTSVVRRISAEVGEAMDLTLLGNGETPARGDLILFGRASAETRQVIVTGVEMAEDMTCLIRMIAAAPEIDAELDAMVPPPWTGRVGWTLPAGTAVPPAPRFTMIRTAQAAFSEFFSDLYGAAGARTVTFALKPGTGVVQTIGYRISHRLAGAGAWSSLDLSVADGGGSLTSYQIGDQVELRAQALGIAGQPGPATPNMLVTVGSGDAAIPGAIEVDGVAVEVLPGGVRISVDNTDPATVGMQLYRSMSGSLNRATDRSGPPVEVEPGRVAVLQAGDTTRRNLVPDPGMDASAAWIKGAGWAVTGGAGVHSPAASGDSLGVNLPLRAGRNYRVAYDLTISAGNVRSRLTGGSGTITGTQRTTSGRWSDTLTSPVNQTRLEILASSAANASIDNLLAYAVTPACLPQGTNYFWVEPLNADGVAGAVIGPFSAIIE